ncbi:MAG: TIGR04348 family glycosyltransferase [Planctomycetes bacterium]|nr:TIGR04348 family glycosyltransferase [Planctomycetota bacterium]
MRITIATPSLEEPTGNGRTALRWRDQLADLGHHVEVRRSDDEVSPKTELLVAIHALKSAVPAMRFKENTPDRPLFVLLSGTDLYRDVRAEVVAREVLDRADRLITLHPLAARSLSPALRFKARWIPQSCARPSTLPERPRDRFRVIVVSNLRDVKDPLRTLEALAHLHSSSTIEVHHYGVPIDHDLAERAALATNEEQRYRYFGARDHDAILQAIGGSHLLSLTSLMEGGANVVSEAIVVGTPVVSSRIEGSLGLLGEDYPATFPIGDDRALAELLGRCEENRSFWEQLREWVSRRSATFEPEAERRAWRELLEEWSP